MNKKDFIIIVVIIIVAIILGAICGKLILDNIIWKREQRLLSIS